MEELLNNSVLEELYENRNEQLSHYIITNKSEYKEIKKAMEDKLRELLNFISGEHYKYLEDEIDNFLYENVLNLSEFWCSKYYKVGFADGLSVKKDIQKEMEGLSNG